MRHLRAVVVAAVVGAIGGCGNSGPSCTTSVKKNCPVVYSFNPAPCPDSLCDRDAIRCAVCWADATHNPTFEACYINATNGNMYYCVSPN